MKWYARFKSLIDNLIPYCIGKINFLRFSLDEILIYSYCNEKVQNESNVIQSWNDNVNTSKYTILITGSALISLLLYNSRLVFTYAHVRVLLTGRPWFNTRYP